MTAKRERARDFLAYGFAISIAVHAIVLPFVRAEKPAAADEQPPQRVDIAQMPTPPPTPRPTPTPHPTPAPSAQPTPPPQRAQPHRRPLRIRAPHAEARAGGPREAANARLAGDVLGGAPSRETVPPGGGDLVTPAPPVATATPRPTPTPQSCARPNVPATTVRAAEPEMPALAQAQGITGTVGVVVSLDVRSRVVTTHVQTSPSALLDAAAVAAARGSEFRTEVRDCVPIAADYLFSVEFTAQ